MANDAPDASPASTILSRRPEVPRRKSSFTAEHVRPVRQMAARALLGIAGDGHHRPRRQLPQLFQRPPTSRRKDTIRSPATPRKKIAIIDVAGAIMEGEGFVKRQIDARAGRHRASSAVVLRVNSPGGTVTGSDYIYHHLRELVDERKLPMVVSMGSICASGGYYVAMAVGDEPDAIFAEPTTWTGSIGVIIPHYDLSGPAWAAGT